MQIRDPDILLAVIAQLKSQFGNQIAELNDALALAHVTNAALGAEVKQLKDNAEPPLRMGDIG